MVPLQFERPVAQQPGNRPEQRENQALDRPARGGEPNVVRHRGRSYLRGLRRRTTMARTRKRHPAAKKAPDGRP